MPEQPTAESPLTDSDRITAAARAILADRAEKSLVPWETVDPGDVRAVAAQLADYARRIRAREMPELEAATATAAYTGDVVLIDSSGGEGTAYVELFHGADPRTPTLRTWHGRVPNGVDRRWAALNANTFRIRMPDGQERQALIDAAGLILGIGYPPFDE